MKKIPWGRTNDRYRGARAGIAALVLVLVFVLLRLFTPNLFLSIAAPVFMLGNTLTTHTTGFFSGFANTRALAAKNAALIEQNSALSAENRTLVVKVHDVTALLGSTPTPPSGILAGVLARPPMSAYDTLVVAAGRGSGVSLGMEAFGEGGVPLGVVKAASLGFSRITLFSAPGVATAAWVGSARVPVTLHGAGGGAYTASVPRTSGIAPGDAVSISGPGAVLIGTVLRVAGAPSEPVATLHVQPITNPFSITWVTLRDEGALFIATSTSP